MAIQIKNRFTGVVLITIDSENLRGANLWGANLECANLRGANLRGADITEVYFNNANIACAVIEKKIYSIAGIGSNKRMTTYNATDNVVWCGCFIGTIEEFEEQIKKTYKPDSDYCKNYMAAVAYFKALV